MSGCHQFRLEPCANEDALGTVRHGAAKRPSRVVDLLAPIREEVQGHATCTGPAGVS
jgi:hypothetical protein